MKRKILSFLGAIALFFILGIASSSFKENETASKLFMLLAFGAPIFLLFWGFSKTQAQRLLERQQWQAAEWRRQGELSLLQMIDAALSDGRLTQAEVDGIVKWAQTNGIPLDGPAGWKLRQAIFLQSLLNGTPCEPPVAPPDGIAWEPGEKFLYAWPQTMMAEFQTKKQYVAGSSGLSIRVCSGVYVRTGGVRGHIEESKGFVSLGVGPVAITNRNLYVMAPIEPIKAPLKNLVSVRALENGVVLSFSGRQKMLGLDAGDHWFMANVIMNARHVP